MLYKCYSKDVILKSNIVLVLLFFIVIILLPAAILPFGVIGTRFGASGEVESDWIPAIALDSPTWIDQDTGEHLEVLLKGQQVNFTLGIEIEPKARENASSVDYVAIAEMRDQDGITLWLQKEQGKLTSEKSQDLSISWKASASGNFEVRVFVISSLDNPLILSKSLTSTIRVVGSSSELDLLGENDRTDKKEGSELSNDALTKIKTSGNYTVLVYMVASGLESEGYRATDDIIEMEAIGSNPSVKIVIETGGAANAQIDNYRFIDFTKVQRHLVMKDRIIPLQDLGEINMASAKSLSDFIYWGINEFPSEKYAIVLWDHGAGLLGFGFDDIYNDTLTLDEIHDGLEPAKRVGNLEIIGFDACLMASVEVGKELSSIGKYLVASEDLEPGWGWDYSAILSSLNDNPHQKGDELGKVVADSYIVHTKLKSATYGDYGSEKAITMSVIDLKKIPGLVEQVDKVGDYFDKYLGDHEITYSLMKTVRGTERYGEGGKQASGHLDLYHFAVNLNERFPDLSGLADGLKSSAEEAVVYHVSGDAKPDSHGISVFMQVQEYEPNAPYLKFIIGSWISVFEYARRALENDNLGPVVLMDMKQDGNNTIFGKITGNDVAIISQYYTTQVPENKLRLRILSSVDMDASDFIKDTDKYGFMSFVWDKKIMSLCNINEQDCQPTSIFFERNGHIEFAYVYVKLESSRYNGTLFLIYTVNENKNLTFIGGWPGLDEHGNAVRELLPIVAGDRIFTYVNDLAYVPDSEETYSIAVESHKPIVVSDGFGPIYHSYPGEYDLVIAACDFSDNCSYSNEFHFKVQ